MVLRNYATHIRMIQSIAKLKLDFNCRYVHMAWNMAISFFVTAYDKVSAIVQISLPLAAYFDIPQIAVKIDFFKQNHQLL